VARTGRFGRSPRSAPSLTATLVAIAREFQNQRAQNIMDAWQKGGMFEGSKATDDKVLKFWKDKAAGVSKDDPLYDTYKNAHTQLDYTISESKMTAWYATSPKGGAQDQRMVAFYLNWAKKVPKDSEFYRVLQRDAGQYMRVQRSNGRAEANRRKEERYQQQQADTQKQMEAPAEYLVETLRRLAQSGVAALGLPMAIAQPGSGSDFTDFTTEDPDIMNNLIAAITSEGKTISGTLVITGDGEFRGSDTVLYHTDDGQPVTGKSILQQLGKLDPNFKPGVPFDAALVVDYLKTAGRGLDERIARAKSTGHMTDVNNLTKSKSYLSLIKRTVGSMDVQDSYMDLRETYDAVKRDRTASPQALMNAWTDYSGGLMALSKDPSIATDDAFRGRIMAEVLGTAGVPTLNESFTGLANSQFNPSASTDAMENFNAIEFVRAQIESVKSGAALWTLGELNDAGVFVPKAGGKMIGAATQETIAAGGLNAQTVTVADPRGGSPITMSVTAIPIYATAKDPLTGKPLSTNGNIQPIGYAYDFPGKATQYAYTTRDGPIFTSDPLSGDKPMTASSKGGNHLEVDYSDEVAAHLGFADKDPVTGMWTKVPDLSADANLPVGIQVRASTDIDPKTNAYKPSAISFDPQDFAWRSGTRGALGAPDPITDFGSLTLSTLMADSEGQAILNDLDKHPAFRQTMEDDAYRGAGFDRDFKTGAWVPGANADQTKLNKDLGQQNIAAHAKSLMGFISEAAGLFQRTVTGSPAGKSDSTTSFPDLRPLATDLVKGTPFEALGNAFFPKTSSIRPLADAKDTRFTIKPVKSIKVAMPDVKTTVALLGQQPTGTTYQPPALPNSQSGMTAPTSSQSGMTSPTGSTGGSGSGGMGPKAV